MKSRSGKAITGKEVITYGLAPVQSIEKLVRNQAIDLIAFGESHWYQNPHRKLLMDSLAYLSDSGFSTLALELEIKYQEVFDQYSLKKIDKEELQKHLLAAADSIFDSEERACPYYFGAIETAIDNGMEIVVVDKNRDDHLWNHPGFAECSRDSFMAQRLKEICTDKRRSGGVVFFAGNNHLYKRPGKFEDLTVIESLSLSGLKTISIGGVLFSDKKVTGLTFKGLYPLTRFSGEAKLIKTDHPGLDIFLGKERRCAWGGCNSETEKSCPGIEFNLCQSIIEDDIYSDYWDYIVLYDWQWMRSDCK